MIASPPASAGAGERVRAAADVVLIVLFVVAVAAPGVTHFFTPDDPDAVRAENRSPAPAPGLPRTWPALAAFPERFAAYLDDAFRFRTPLVRAYNATKLFLLETAPSDAFLVGEDGWLFTTVNEIVLQHRGLRSATADDLDTLLRTIRRRREWLATLGCRYVALVAPDKASIYADRLPAWLRAAPLGPIPLDQLAERAREVGEPALVDVRATLLEARDEALLYYPYGTHWNPLGAYHAYHALFGRLAGEDPRLSPFPLERYDVTPVRELADSWGRATHLEDELLQPSFRVELVGGPEIAARPGGWKTALRRVWEQADASLPTALVLADSFGENLLPFVLPHFSRTYEVHGYELDPAVVQVLRPDVVVQVVVERTVLHSAFRMDAVEEEFFRRLERGDGAAAEIEALAAFVGTYRNPVLGTVDVRVEGDGLAARYREMAMDLALEPRSQGLFAVTGRQHPMSVVFERESPHGPSLLTAITPHDLKVMAFVKDGAPGEAVEAHPSPLAGAYDTASERWLVVDAGTNLVVFTGRGDYVGELRRAGPAGYTLERRRAIGTARFGPTEEAPEWIDLDLERSISKRAPRAGR